MSRPPAVCRCARSGSWHPAGSRSSPRGPGRPSARAGSPRAGRRSGPTRLGASLSPARACPRPTSRSGPPQPEAETETDAAADFYDHLDDLDSISPRSPTEMRRRVERVLRPLIQHDRSSGHPAEPVVAQQPLLDPQRQTLGTHRQNPDLPPRPGATANRAQAHLHSRDRHQLDGTRSRPDHQRPRQASQCLPSVLTGFESDHLNVSSHPADQRRSVEQPAPCPRRSSHCVLHPGRGPAGSPSS